MDRAVSPDGRFLAYQSDADGRPEVYVRLLAPSSGRWQISNAGGEEPMWAPDGKSIYYRIEGRMMKVPVTATETFEAGLPVQIFDGVYNLRSDTGISYQPHPDGTRLLMTRRRRRHFRRQRADRDAVVRRAAEGEVGGSGDRGSGIGTSDDDDHRKLRISTMSPVR